MQWLTEKVGDTAIWLFIGFCVWVLSYSLKFPPLFIYLGGIMVLSVGLWAGIDNVRLNNKLKKSIEICALEGEEKKGEKDDYCFVSSSVEKKANSIQMMLIHKGNRPVPDVHVEAMDLQKIRETAAAKKESINSDDIEACCMWKSVGVLAPESGKPLVSFKIPSKASSLSYDFNIMSRDELILQKTRLQKINGEWVCATKAIKNGVLVHAEIPKNYPRNNSGEIEW